MSTTVILARHATTEVLAQTKGQPEKLKGKSNDNISRDGVLQTKNFENELRGRNLIPNQIYASEIQRAQDTAGFLAVSFGIERVGILDLLNERTSSYFEELGERESMKIIGTMIPDFLKLSDEQKRIYPFHSTLETVYQVASRVDKAITVMALRNIDGISLGITHKGAIGCWAMVRGLVTWNETGPFGDLNMVNTGNVLITVPDPINQPNNFQVGDISGMQVSVAQES